ncbi:DNA/RNA non-specific endonuclease [Dactylosporangium sp. AC04546]|uniref:DNA/RNA non-specific endonuclease n=1 Tax=Dactylosporangium sp. AC04546 TaxID=2862460 RepID=UPI001EDDCCD9|nr:DNA/RNA non-specific endonuclease [Dactylosporangium sp. AC04546]WVK78960.1 DNA/RNA non-specific endonuclease [Dactylosporangium sp. AC04546]
MPVVRFRAGRPGAWNRTANRPLQPNTAYIEKRTGYTYRTDANGRVTSFSGRLRSGTGHRNAYQQARSGRRDRRATDQGGHLFAHIFRGPGERINLVPMDSNLNLSAWKRMENRWARALDGGSTVRVEGRVEYPPGSTRPSRFVVVENIDGRVRRHRFVNT